MRQIERTLNPNDDRAHPLDWPGVAREIVSAKFLGRLGDVDVYVGSEFHGEKPMIGVVHSWGSDFTSLRVLTEEYATLGDCRNGIIDPYPRVMWKDVLDFVREVL
jgi:hypothetical protein